MSDDKIAVHMDLAHQHDTVPTSAPDRCPKCSGDVEVGFGLAGGGYGAYTYCPKCGDILSKTQEQ